MHRLITIALTLLLIAFGSGVSSISSMSAASVSNSTVTTSLKLGKPLWISPSATVDGGLPAIDPSHPNRVAYCAPNAIRDSNDAVRHWESIPITSVVAVAAHEGFPLLSTLPNPPSTPACGGLLLDPDHPKSYFATLETYQAGDSAPPVYLLGFITANAGKSWWPVPVPTGYTPNDFGGFRLAGNSVLALFSKEPDTVPVQKGFVVLRTDDGGNTWTFSNLPCPATGPCVSWGPAPTAEISGGIPGWQSLYHSTTGGRLWQGVEPPVAVLDFSNGAQLVALSSSKLVLLDASAEMPAPVRVSLDGGRSWQVAMLPPLPGTSSPPVELADLLMLPNGALLAIMEFSGGPLVWDLLPAGASSWCPVSPKTLPASATDLVTSGTRLWWFVQIGSTQPGQSPPRSTPLSAFHCGG